MDVFDLFAKLTLDSSEYERNLGSAQKETSSFASKLKSGLATAAKVTATAVVAVGTAATAATVKLAKEAVSAYANYEQLVGGVETLFAGSAKLVQSYAANAYKTAGLSANEYMETVTSFSASLLQSLGGDTERAANVADMAIRDMSDNANKMGTAMESIQMAYQGFAKQNYTMLDNLKLGYGGTKSEMERLILDAESLSDTFTASRDENGNLAMSYADIVDAIHIVQDEMGITGTTAKEASATISGSVSAAKSAWKNLVAGIANENADMTSLIDNFVESVGTAGENVLPRVEKALEGVGQLVSTLGPIIAKSAPDIIRSVALPMISTISGLLPDLIPVVTDLLFSLVDALLENLDPIIDAGITLMLQLGNGLIKAAPKLVTAAIKIITQLAKALTKNVKPMIEAGKEAIKELIAIFSEQDTLSDLIEAGLELLLALADGLIEAIPSLVEQIPIIIESILSAITDNMPMIFEAATTIITSLIEGLVENLPQLLDAAIEILLQLVDALTQNIELLVDAAIAIITAIADGLVVAIPTLVEKAPEIIGKLLEALIEAAPKLWDASVELIDAIVEGIGKVLDTIWDQGEVLINELWDGIKACWEDVKSWGAEVIDKVVEGFDEAWDTIVSIGTNIVNGLWDGISGAADWLWQKVSGWVSDLVDGVLDFLGIASPSKVFAEIGDYTAQGFGVGFGKQFKKVSDDVRKKMSSLSDQTVDLTSNFTANLPESVFSGSAYKENARKNDDNMQAVLNVLNEIKDKNMTIVLSDGTIAGRVDKLLGKTALRKVRGNA